MSCPCLDPKHTYIVVKVLHFLQNSSSQPSAPPSSPPDSTRKPNVVDSDDDDGNLCSVSSIILDLQFSSGTALSIFYFFFCL